MTHCFIASCFLFLLTAQSSKAFPEEGKWIYDLKNVNGAQNLILPKTLFNDSLIQIKVLCTSKTPHTELFITASLYQLKCLNGISLQGDKNHDILEGLILLDNRTTEITKAFECGDILQPSAEETKSISRELSENKNNGVVTENRGKSQMKRNAEDNGGTKQNDNSAANGGVPTKTVARNEEKASADHKITMHVLNDGMYVLGVILHKPQNSCNISIQVDMKGPHGYLSAADWPLLPFYGAMCIVYVLFGVAWLVVSFCQWRDLLRIQFWIGGVILLGMLEKATFYAEYQSINSTGQSVKGAVLMAELVSCAKRMLARMLVIIVSLGFGIVKPRLGPMLHRVVGTGVLYFVLASVESYLRVMHQKNDINKQVLISGIPLAVLDSAICWWIFTSLVQTTRTLRLRRNLVKLSLYHHFTNTLIFAVGSSIIFMLYVLKYHKFTSCLKDWRELWVDDAYWHLLFSVILLVIMILWRPTNNNQRYAFTPLLDAPEDDDDEEDEQFVNDAFGVKLRNNRSNSPRPKSSNTMEEDLKWVEENIPSSVPDIALPILDSDEEIMTTKFEVSKMQ